MKTIPLTQGYEALVDDEDYEALSKFTWHVEFHGKSCRAARSIYRAGKPPGRIGMHQQIMDVNGVDHRDRNGLNNQRSNLRVTDHTH